MAATAASKKSSSIINTLFLNSLGVCQHGSRIEVHHRVATRAVTVTHPKSVDHLTGLVTEFRARGPVVLLHGFLKCGKEPLTCTLQLLVICPIEGSTQTPSGPWLKILRIHSQSLPVGFDGDSSTSAKGGQRQQDCHGQTLHRHFAV